MSDVKIEWKGMSPTEETKSRMEETLQAIKYLLPPDSDIKFSIERFHKSYEGNIVVRSPLGDFAAHETHKDPFVLCKNLRKILKQQIFKFRQTHQTWHRAA